MSQNRFHDDISRLKYVYRKRDIDEEFWNHKSWGLLDPYIEYSENHFKFEILAALRSSGLRYDDLHNFKILEIGCGWGRNLNQFAELGVPAHNLYGIDLIDHFIEHGKTINPASSLICGNVLEYPFSVTFDVILMHTVLSSLMEDNVRSQLIEKSLSLLSPGGNLLIYDILPNYNTAPTSDNIPYIKGVDPNFIKQILSEHSSINIAIKTVGLTPRFRRLALGTPLINSRVRKIIADILALFKPCNGYFFLQAQKAKSS